MHARTLLRQSDMAFVVARQAAEPVAARKHAAARASISTPGGSAPRASSSPVPVPAAALDAGLDAASLRLLRDAEAAYAVGRYKEALLSYEELSASPTFNDVDPLYKLPIGVRSAACASECGQFSSALKWLGGCERKFRELSDNGIIFVRELASCQLAYGNCYYRMGRATEAVTKLEEALTLFERGDAPEGIVASSCNLAALYGMRGEFDRAMALLERAERKCASPPRSVTGRASSLHSIQIHSRRGHLYFGHGDFSNAVNNFIIANNLSVTLHGAGSRQAASTMTQLAHACLREEPVDFAAVELLLLNASDIFTSSSVVDTSTEYGEICVVFGHFFSSAGDSRQAIVHYREGFTLLSRVLPPCHPLLGDLMRAMGDLSEAPLADDYLAAAQFAARRSQTACAGPGCVRKLREDGAPLDVCALCRRTFYCGKACQDADWRREGGHRAECKTLNTGPDVDVDPVPLYLDL